MTNKNKQTKRDILVAIIAVVLFLGVLAATFYVIEHGESRTIPFQR